MNTAWILVFLLSPFHTYSTSTTIENLASSDECTRVAKVIIDWQKDKTYDYKCIEVIRK